MRFWRSFALLAIVPLIISGCSGGASNAPQSPGGHITLNLWIFEGEDVFVPNLVSAFEKLHPNITIKVTDIPENSYVTKIDTALAAGQPPDIGYIYDPRWIKAGKMLPLDDVIAADKINTSNYDQTAFAFCQLNEHTYCLGSYAGAIMLFYNKTLFDKAGLPYPSATQPMTIDQYAALAAKLTQPNKDLSKYVWGGYADVTSWWMDLRTIFNPDGTKVEGYLNDAPTVHAYTVLASMIKNGTSPSNSDYQFFGKSDPLATGQQAMTIVDNVTAIPELEKAGIPWGAAPTPVEQASDAPWVSSWSDYWGVFSGSQNAEAAKEFVAFVGTEGNKLRAQAGGMPLDSTAAVDTKWAGSSPGRAEALQVIALARPGFQLPADIFTIDPPLWDAFTQIVNGSKTAQAALDTAAQAMQQSLDRDWQTWNEISPPSSSSP